MNVDKFQIYYKPKDSNIESFTLRISRINKETNSYKYKVIKEILNNENKIETYKIKEYRNNVEDILNKIDKINLDNIKNENLINNEELYCICLGNKKIITTNKNEIQYILDLFDFEKLYKNF